MPIMFSYNLRGASTLEHNHLQSMFERFGWQQVGGSCYRYPRLAEIPPVEDWFNHVVPALMLFRTYVLGHGLDLVKVSLDAHSSTGIDVPAGIGQPPLFAPDISLAEPSLAQFGEKQLRNWISGITAPYAD